MKHTKIPVRVNGISDGEYTFEYEVQPNTIGLPEEFSDTMHVRAVMDKTNAQVVLSVSISTSAKYPCDRCLSDMTISVQAGFVLFYAKEEDTPSANEDENVKILDPAEPYVDIAPDVVDYALLQIPMRKVCEEFNPGNKECETQIKARERDNDDPDAIDPRWSALKNLKYDKS